MATAFQEATRLKDVLSGITDQVGSIRKESQQMYDLWKNFLSWTERSSRFLPTWALEWTGINKQVALFTGKLEHFIKVDSPEHLRQMQAIYRLWQDLGKTLVVALPAVMAIRSALNDAAKLNEALLSANNLVGDRQKMLTDMLDVQIKTGISTGKLAEIYKALVFYGLESKKGASESARIISMMTTSLGLGVEQGARLAFIFGDRLKVPLVSIANLITQIVDSTSLVADEAARYANELGKAMLYLGSMGKGGGALGTEMVTKAVLEIEGRVKAMGGPIGGITKMFSDMLNTTEGAYRARMFGMRTEDIMRPSGVETFMARFQPLLRQLGSMQGDIGTFNNALDITHEYLNLDRDSLVALVNAEKERLSARRSTQTLEEKWKDTIVNTGQVWETLRGTMKGLLQEALLPLITPLRWVFSLLNDVLEGARKFPLIIKPLEFLLTTLVIVAIPRAIKQIIGLITAITALGARAKASALQMELTFPIGAASSTPYFNSLSAPTKVGAIKGVFKLNGLRSMISGVGSMISRGWTFLLAGGWATALSSFMVGWAVGGYINSLLEPMWKKHEVIGVSRFTSLREEFQALLNRLARDPKTDLDMIQREVSSFIKSRPGEDTTFVASELTSFLPRWVKWMADSRVAQVQMGNLEATKENLLSPEELRKQSTAMLDQFRIQITEQKETNKLLIKANEERSDGLQWHLLGEKGLGSWIPYPTIPGGFSTNPDF